MKIREISNVNFAKYVGARFEINEVKIYEGVGVGLYRNEALITFIRMNKMEVIKMEKNSIGHQYFINDSNLSQGIYIYKEVPQHNIREKERVVKKGNDSSLLYHLYSNSQLKEKYTDMELAHIKDQLLWTVVKIIDNTIAMVKRENLTEIVLLEELFSLEEIKNTFKQTN